MIAGKKQPSPNCLMENDAPAAHETLSHGTPSADFLPVVHTARLRIHRAHLHAKCKSYSR